MNKKTDPVNGCPFHSVENIIIGYDDYLDDDVYELSDICNKPEGTSYCYYVGNFGSCKYLQEVLNEKK